MNKKQKLIAPFIVTLATLQHPINRDVIIIIISFFIYLYFFYTIGINAGLSTGKHFFRSKIFRNFRTHNANI